MRQIFFILCFLLAIPASGATYWTLPDEQRGASTFAGAQTFNEGATVDSSKLKLISSPTQFYPLGTGERKQILHNVAAIHSDLGNQTGSYLLTLPHAITAFDENTFVQITIKGFDYGAQTQIHLVIVGYAKSDATMWTNFEVYDYSEIKRFTTVRLGEDASGKPVIILGVDATVVSYPSLTVTEFEANWAGATAFDYSSGWSFTGPNLDADYTAAGVDIEQTITPKYISYSSASTTYEGLQTFNAGATFTASGGSVGANKIVSPAASQMVFNNAVHIDNNSVQFDYATDADSNVYLNWYGYQAGTTRYRTLNIGDGKGNALIVASPTAINLNQPVTLGPSNATGTTLTNYGYAQLGEAVDTGETTPPFGVMFLDGNFANSSSKCDTISNPLGDEQRIFAIIGRAGNNASKASVTAYEPFDEGQKPYVSGWGSSVISVCKTATSDVFDGDYFDMLVFYTSN